MRRLMIRQAEIATPYLFQEVVLPSSRPFKPVRPKLTFAGLASRFAASISLLLLIEDVQLAKLRGLVRDWAYAYERFLGGLSDILFGWLPFDLTVTPQEAHVLVVTSVFVGAYCRAKFARIRSLGEERDVAIWRVFHTYRLRMLPLLLLAVFAWGRSGLYLVATLGVGTVMMDLGSLQRSLPWAAKSWEQIKELWWVSVAAASLVLLSELIQG